LKKREDGCSFFIDIWGPPRVFQNKDRFSCHT
jgi:hypothetical protein